MTSATMLPANVEQEIRHGWTVNDVNRFAVLAVRADITTRALDMEDRVEAAWSGITVYLLTCDQAPSHVNLIHQGRAALYRLAHEDRHHHGVSGPSAYAGSWSMAGAVKYWTAPTGESLESGVVERLALAEILEDLPERHRATLQALADHDDYPAAAAALGIPYQTFCDRIMRARRAFLELWHEGEQPSAPWRLTRTKRYAPPPRTREVADYPDRVAQLVRDMAGIITAAGADRMPTADILERLAGLRPEWYAGWTGKDLGAVLRTAGVRTSRSIFEPGKTCKRGYYLSDLEAVMGGEGR